MKQRLLIFAKNIIHGEVKTRLAASVGNDIALSVYQHLVDHTIAITDYLPVQKTVFYSKHIEEKDAWDKSLFEKKVQAKGDLGQRMESAFDHAFNEGSEQVVIIGTDCLELTSSIIMNAYAYLNNYDVVLGPAKDGGYYLLAMKKLQRGLFENISWSTSCVLSQTLELCKEKHLTTYLLPELNDIDDENDLKDAPNLKSIVDL